LNICTCIEDANLIYGSVSEVLIIVIEIEHTVDIKDKVSLLTSSCCHYSPFETKK